MITTYFLYSITCIHNDFAYIGITINYDARIKQHFYALKKHAHTNKSLQSDFDLYGESGFSSAIISRAKYSTNTEALLAESKEIHKQKKRYNIAVPTITEPLPYRSIPKLCTKNPNDFFVYWRDTQNKLITKRGGINRIKDLKERERLGNLMCLKYTLEPIRRGSYKIVYVP